MGRPAWFRNRLAGDQERSLPAGPSHTSIRDLEAGPPPYGGHGRYPKVPCRGARAGCAALPGAAWTKLTGRDGAKGPLEVEIVARRGESKVDRRVVGLEETRGVVRSAPRTAVCSSTTTTPPRPRAPRLKRRGARVTKAARRIEEGLKRSKGEAGRGEYQVRNWLGWQHHQPLSPIATWFLIVEADRGKKGGARADGAAGARGAGLALTPGEPLRPAGPSGPGADPSTGAGRVGAVLPLPGK